MTRRILVWDLATRIFHWSLVASFTGAYLTADSDYRVFHVMFGYTVLGLIAFRLLWGFVGPRYALFKHFMRGPVAIFNYLKGLLRGHPEHYTGHNPAGAVAVLSLLVLGLSGCITGILSYDERWEHWMAPLHEFLANLMLAVVVLHVLIGAVLSSFLHHENLIAGMITGRKKGNAEHAIPDGRLLAGLVLATVILAFWIMALPVNPISTIWDH